MKALIIGLAALCLGTVALASSTSGECDGSGGLAQGAAPSSAFGFSAIGAAGRWAGSPA